MTDYRLKKFTINTPSDSEFDSGEAKEVDDDNSLTLQRKPIRRPIRERKHRPGRPIRKREPESSPRKPMLSKELKRVARQIKSRKASQTSGWDQVEYLESVKRKIKELTGLIVQSPDSLSDYVFSELQKALGHVNKSYPIIIALIDDVIDELYD